MASRRGLKWSVQGCWKAAVPFQYYWSLLGIIHMTGLLSRPPRQDTDLPRFSADEDGPIGVALCGPQ